MPVAGIITDDGRKYKAELFSEAAGASSPDIVKGLFWCAVGVGDSNFIDPENPPAPTVDQTGCKVEQIRKVTTDLKYLQIDALGTITFNGVRYSQSIPATNLVLVSWIFDFNEANFIWRELSFHGGDVEPSSTVLTGGLVSAGGQVTNNGRCFYILNIPSRAKDNTQQRPCRLLLTV